MVAEFVFPQALGIAVRGSMQLFSIAQDYLVLHKTPRRAGVISTNHIRYSS